MQKGEEQEISIKDFFTLCEEKDGTYQIETPDGWQDIGSLVQKRNKECYNLVLENGQELGCSADHYVWVTDDVNNPFSYVWKKSEDIDVQSDSVLVRSGDEVWDTGWQKVVAKEHIGTKDTFDLEVKSPTHRYYSNDIVSHNTGKSLTCDALADYWEMPLLRLDMGAVFSAHIGESEGNMRKVIKTAEAVAPCILWIDEVEKGLGGIQSSNRTDGGVTNRVFGSFLTWMQEKTAPVFTICTANNVLEMPPEFMRAGRFDEIFFLDLPTLRQRQEVTCCLLRKKNREPSKFDVSTIAKKTENYSPAEIEKAINNGLFIAYADGQREVTTEDIVREAAKFEPLYNSRNEEIEELRTWALGIEKTGGNAVLANSTPASERKRSEGDNFQGRSIDMMVDESDI